MFLVEQQLKELLKNETNLISILSNTSAFLNQYLNNINWIGFYIYSSQNNQLELGPFQGKVACSIIPIEKGVCGKAFSLKETLVVDDVSKFKGHIACDCESKSEIVIPLKNFGVLDVDSPVINRFTKQDKLELEACMEIILSKINS